jgi:hypothetical protein
MTEKRQTSQGYIIRILYNISQRNFGILILANFVMLFQAVMVAQYSFSKNGKLTI